VDKSRAIPLLCINRIEILKASMWLNLAGYLGAKAVDETSLSGGLCRRRQDVPQTTDDPFLNYVVT